MSNPDNKPPAIDTLLNVMARLRHPQDGCAWDRKQTWHSLIPYTLEEAYEVAEAIDHHTPEQVCQELGDLLFQVVFYARIAEEQGMFDFDDVCVAISDKLICRHPHVFESDLSESQRQAAQDWEAHKARERQSQQRHTGVLDGVSLALPALMRAQKLQSRAARVGFDWPEAAPVFEKVAEELTELRAADGRQAQQEELGDVLFTLVNLARHLELDAETALRQANDKFTRRMQVMQGLAQRQGLDLHSADQTQLEQWWETAKAGEKKE